MLKFFPSFMTALMLAAIPLAGADTLPMAKKLEVTQNIKAGRTVPNSFTVTATDADRKPVKNATIKAFVRSGELLLFTNQVPDTTAKGKTNDGGKVTFFIAGDTSVPAVVLFAQVTGAQDAAIIETSESINVGSSPASAGARRSRSAARATPATAAAATPLAAPADDPPANDPPAEDPPAEEPPGEERPAEEPPAEEDAPPTVAKLEVKQDFKTGKAAPVSFTVTAKDADGEPVEGATIKGIVRSGGLLLFTTGKPGSNAQDVTGADGRVKIFIAGDANAPATVQVAQVTGDDGTPVLETSETINVNSSGLADTLGSKRSYLQLFIGQTFRNAYEDFDKDGNPETTDDIESRNVGFRNAGPLIRLTFNTMWPCQSDTSIVCRRLAPVNGLVHTDANLEFSRFPFGDDAAKENEAGVDDAFSGSLGLAFAPNAWASYDERLTDDLKNEPHNYDAYRFALFMRMGATTRLTQEADGNNSIYRFQAGLRFTHSRSDQAHAESEDRNHVPIRFVEASYGRFSEWGENHGANRLVIDAGLRISALSNEVFPVYVGGHLNSGPGEDDLRIFLGVLMKLDVLGRLVQGLVPSPE